MVLQTEYQQTKEQVLIIDKHTSSFTQLLKEELRKFDNDVFIAPSYPVSFSRFDIVFIVNGFKYPDEVITTVRKKFIFIFTNHKKRAEKLHEQIQLYGSGHIKIISIENTEITAVELEKIMWFTFGRSEEIFLTIHTLQSSPPRIKHSLIPKLRLRRLFLKLTHPRRLLLIFFCAFIVFHTLFIPPLLIASFIHLQAEKSILKKEWQKATSQIRFAKNMLNTSQQLYALARPTFLLFSIVIIPDNAFEINTHANSGLLKAVDLYHEGSNFMETLLKSDKTEKEKELMSVRLKNIQTDIGDLNDDLTTIYQKLPNWGMYLSRTKATIKDTISLLNTVSKIVPYTETVLSKQGERTYLLLFANNMEIRPGGGFIGSFGILKTKNFSIEDLKIYDVYDADGQLLTHVPPPAPIEKYLQQPHWFLRDSAFSPDFSENYTQAKMFLEKELGLSQFDGAVLITTTAIQNILSAVGTVYLPDFKENVTKDNFYLKAQLYAEKGFFPGSQQKKRFLSAVTDQLLLAIDTTPLPPLIKMVKKSLDEKQIVMYFDDSSLQSIIDANYWSGRVLEPNCAAKNENCVTDYLFSYDANLGVNKANFFVNRSYALRVKIDPEGTIRNTLTVKFRNDSPNNVFPGGTYKNYAQIALPRDSVIKTVTKNGTLIESYDEKNTQYKSIGFFIEIPPQTESEIVVAYQLPKSVTKGQGVYQLVVQKQIGSPNSDFNLTLELPKNIYLVNQNFSPLVKDNLILYNTTLTADKIFFIDLARE